jgi:hypothetical protein
MGHKVFSLASKMFEYQNKMIFEKNVKFFRTGRQGKKYVLWWII